MFKAITIFCLISVFVAASAIIADDTKSFDVDFYGYLKLDGAYDQNQTSHGNFSMWVNERSNDQDDEQFNMTANESRFGMNVVGNNYQNVKVTGKLEFDLYAGVTGTAAVENNAMLQLRHAYFSVESGDFKLLAGQTWDLISPLNPATLNYPVLWGCGNIGYRRPQVSLWYNMHPNQDMTVTMAGGFFRTIGSDVTPTFSLGLGETSDGSDDGTDAGIPSFQGLLDIKHNFAKNGFVRVGVSGLWGQLKAETNLNNSETYESWGGVGHLMIAMPSGFGISGEAFMGNNLGSYFGGILNTSTIEGVEAIGGWGSLWIQPSDKVKFSGGYGLDDPKDEDLLSGRAKNSCIFGNIRYYIVPKVTLGLEVSQWETEYVNADTAKNLRVQSAFIMNF